MKTPREAAMILERRATFLQKQIDEGTHSDGSADFIRAEIGALRVAIPILHHEADQRSGAASRNRARYGVSVLPSAAT